MRTGEPFPAPDSLGAAHPVIGPPEAPQDTARSLPFSIGVPHGKHRSTGSAAAAHATVEIPAQSPAGHAYRRTRSFSVGVFPPPLLVVGWTLWAWALYRPWVQRPFDILDFSEFLPLLRQHESTVDRLAAFVSYYAAQGRVNVLQYVAIVAKWAMFGWDSRGWQLTRFVLMVFIVIGVYAVLRRLRVTATAAAIGASLYVCGQAASQGWMRLTMGEPLGFLFLILAAIVAAGYQSSRRPTASALLISFLVALALLSKEMLVAGIPFVLAIACCRRPDGSFGVIGVTRRNAILVSLLAIGSAAILLPIAVVALSTRGTSFTSSYGTTSPSIWRFLGSILVTALPGFPTQSEHVSILILPANLLFLAVLVVGYQRSFLRGAPDRDDLWVRTVIALSLPVSGAILYQPWPYFLRFYAIPFALGLVFILAAGVSLAERHSRRSATLAYAGCAGIFFFCSVSAYQEARTAEAKQYVNARLSQVLTTLPPWQPVVVAVRQAPPQAWQGPGATLRRYTLATSALTVGADLPPVTDSVCARTPEEMTSRLRDTTLISYGELCGLLAHPTRRISQRFSFFDWRTLSIRPDSFTVDVWNADQGRLH
jgi:hypothetical protein